MHNQRLAPYLIAFVVLLVADAARAHAPRCTRIVDGEIYTSDGEPVTLGFDEYGYNYQAHLFRGSYCDASRGAACNPAYEGVQLTMWWNEAWLSNRDCTDDGELDRHLGFDSYRGSDAVLTQVIEGSYEQDGRTCRYRQRSVIRAAPLDAELIDGIWYDADGEELGEVIWEEFYVELRRLSDPCGGVEEEGA